MAFASATHDIAADGFYMLSLSKHEQAWWVGLRSTFYRTAMIVGSGLLVVLAGVLESKNGLPPVEIPVSAKAQAAMISNWDPADGENLGASPASCAWSRNPARWTSRWPNAAPPKPRPSSTRPKAWNVQHGFVPDDKPAHRRTIANRLLVDERTFPGRCGLF